MPEMRKCKECGKLFVPKSPRSQYCDAVHYRPCPVCGKPVEAKYLSDPARCCSKECQQIARKQSSSAKPTVSSARPLTNVFSSEDSASDDIKDNNLESAKFEISKGSTHVTYIGKPLMKFIPGHEYIVTVSKEDNCPYLIEASYDVTDGCKSDAAIYLASRISIANYFVKEQMVG